MSMSLSLVVKAMPCHAVTALQYIKKNDIKKVNFKQKVIAQMAICEARYFVLI